MMLSEWNSDKNKLLRRYIDWLHSRRFLTFIYSNFHNHNKKFSFFFSAPFWINLIRKIQFATRLIFMAFLLIIRISLPLPLNDSFENWGQCLSMPNLIQIVTIFMECSWNCANRAALTDFYNGIKLMRGVGVGEVERNLKKENEGERFKKCRKTVLSLWMLRSFLSAP